VRLWSTEREGLVPGWQRAGYYASQPVGG
jgi:hypothetical protein